MEKANKLCIAVAFFLCVFQVVVSAEPASAEDCTQAERYYQYAETKLTSSAERRYAFEKAVSLCPSNALYRTKLAAEIQKIALQGSGMIKREDPKVADSAELWRQYSKMLDDAAAQYEKALQADPKAFDAIVGLAQVYYVQNRLELAADLYKRALKIKSGDETAKAGLAIVKKQLADAGPGKALRKADDIVKHTKTAPPKPEELRTMGFARGTVVTEMVKDRQTFNNILFDEWSFDLDRPEAIQQLMEIGNALSSPDMARFRVVIEGHTDNRGDFDRNMILSRDRAAVVKQFLISQFGVNSARVIEQGFGFTRPRVPNDSDFNMQLNRRVELIFIE